MAVPVPKGADFGRNKRTRRTLVMAVVFVLYLVLGGVAFRYLETYDKVLMVPQPEPAWSSVQEYLHLMRNSAEDLSNAWEDLKKEALSNCTSETIGTVDELLELALADQDSDTAAMTLDGAMHLCGARAYRLVQEERNVSWSFIDSVYFCMTVVTTIGYGHISPTSSGGQIFCIVYSLLGIPTSGLLLAGLSDFFAGNLLNFYDSKWQNRYGDSRWSLAAFTAIYLLVGFLLFVFVPAVVFTWLEDWNYREAVYYAFITLSTIGFGDFTAAVAADDSWTTVYKVFVMVWILVGLGYWVLVLNFLQKTLKSKEVMETLKTTSRLIAKEAEDLRQALSEVGLIHRDAVFIPEHSKMALNMMLSMGSTLAGATQPASPGETPKAVVSVRGIHTIGDNLRSGSLLAALMASLPPPAAAASSSSAVCAASSAMAAQPTSVPDSDTVTGGQPPSLSDSDTVTGGQPPSVPDSDAVTGGQPPSLPDSDAVTGGQPPSLPDSDAVTGGQPPSVPDSDTVTGQVNAGYLSDGTPERSAAVPAMVSAAVAPL